ncbi:ParB/RepB/Spo0J family partition protein [Mycobacteroides abscessus]|uniref:ParB/RepB/Spo0J family partition protein n=1 Tax=Mycobacteroides abscessus TaxID=36809 RepID=UPI000C2560EA|nr:ParB/RepB/Spo0J family partition protein [Mycobacteroides abscessus]
MTATTAVKFQALPPLSPDEYAELERSILHSGVMVPIVVDEHGVVIDGHHRQKIAKHHNLPLPTETRAGFTDAEKRSLALQLNVARRHLTREQRRALVAESIKADPQLSDREHGRRTGVHNETAAAVRKELVTAGVVTESVTRIGRDGVPQPASKPRPVPEPVEDDDQDIADDAVAEPDWRDEAADTDEPEPEAKRRRRPITDAFDSAAWDLSKIITRIENLAADDRFEKNKDQIASTKASDLVRARDALQRVIEKLSH